MQAELWANRTLAHAQIASEYGAAGLLGLTWRTFETAPQIKALAQSGWSESTAGVAADPATPEGFYLDFCSSNFGVETSARCAELFLSVDGYGPEHKPGKRSFHLTPSEIPSVCIRGDLQGIAYR